MLQTRLIDPAMRLAGPLGLVIAARRGVDFLDDADELVPEHARESARPEPARRGGEVGVADGERVGRMRASPGPGVGSGVGRIEAEVGRIEAESAPESPAGAGVSAIEAGEVIETEERNMLKKT